MKKETIIKKVILKLSAVNPKNLNDLIEIIKISSDEETIFNYVFKFLKLLKSPEKEEDIKIILTRLILKEKLPKISLAHKEAFMRLLKSFPFVELKV